MKLFSSNLSEAPQQELPAPSLGSTRLDVSSWTLLKPEWSHVKTEPDPMVLETETLQLSMGPLALPMYLTAVSPLSCYANAFHLPVDKHGKLPGQALCLDHHLPSASCPWSLGLREDLPLGPVHRSDVLRVDSSLSPGAVGLCLHSCKRSLHAGAITQAWKQQGRAFWFLFYFHHAATHRHNSKVAASVSAFPPAISRHGPALYL